MYPFLKHYLNVLRYRRYLGETKNEQVHGKQEAAFYGAQKAAKVRKDGKEEKHYFNSFLSFLIFLS